MNKTKFRIYLFIYLIWISWWRGNCQQNSSLNLFSASFFLVGKGHKQITVKWWTIYGKTETKQVRQIWWTWRTWASYFTQGSQKISLIRYNLRRNLMEREKDTITFWGSGIISQVENRSKCHEREVCLNHSKRSKNVYVPGCSGLAVG